MDGYYNRRQDLITVMEVEADVSRVCKVIYTEALAIAALFISVLTLLSFEIPVMTISNDFEYVWDIKGKMLITGITVDGCGITTFNPVILIFYIMAIVAAAAAVIYIVWNLIHAFKAEHGETLILTGKPYKRLKTIIGGALTIDAAILLFHCFISLPLWNQPLIFMVQVQDRKHLIFHRIIHDFPYPSQMCWINPVIVCVIHIWKPGHWDTDDVESFCNYCIDHRLRRNRIAPSCFSFFISASRSWKCIQCISKIPTDPDCIPDFFCTSHKFTLPLPPGTFQNASPHFPDRPSKHPRIQVRLRSPAFHQGEN